MSLLVAAKAQVATARVAQAAGMSAQKLSAAGGTARGHPRFEKFAAPRHMSAQKLSAADTARQLAGLSIEQVAVEAGFSASTYRRWRRRRVAPDFAIARLAAAIKRLSRADAAGNGADVAALVEATYGGFLAAVCAQLRLDVATVRVADPSLGQNTGSGGVAASRARQLAIYLTNTALGVRQCVLARVIGITPAGVCIALRNIEDMRDDPAFDALVEAAARQVTGRAG